MLPRILALCLLTTSLIAIDLPAATITLYGPTICGSDPAVSQTFSDTFSAEPGQALLTVTTGNAGDSDDGAQPVHATVTLNGAVVFAHQDFSPQAGQLNAPVELLASNTLEVFLNKGSRGYLTVVLTREMTPPGVSLRASPATICPGQAVVLSWQADGVDGCRIEPGVGDVPPVGTTTVSPTSTTTYRIRAENPLGAANATATVTTLPSTEAWLTAFPPSISLGGSTSLSWRSENAGTCSITPDIGAVDSEGSVTVSPLESTTYTLTAPGPCGTVKAEETIVVESDLGLIISSPLQGARIARPTTLVQGKVLNSKASGVGVTADGRPALVDGDKFYANHVPLIPGNNTIQIAVRDSDGLLGFKTRRVFQLEPDRYIDIVPDAYWGTSPFETTVRVRGSFDPIDPVLSGSGPGPVAFNPTPESDEYVMRIEDPGLYRIDVSARDRRGEVHTALAYVQVEDPLALDAKLRATWDGMKGALQERDLVRAAGFFTRDNRDLYREIFTTLFQDLPQVSLDMQPIGMVYVRDDLAKYRIAKDEYYDGEWITITHHIYFRRGSDGMWKILRF